MFRLLLDRRKRKENSPSHLAFVLLSSSSFGSLLESRAFSVTRTTAAAVVVVVTAAAVLLMGPPARANATLEIENTR